VYVLLAICREVLTGFQQGFKIMLKRATTRRRLGVELMEAAFDVRKAGLYLGQGI